MPAASASARRRSLGPSRFGPAGLCPVASPAPHNAVGKGSVNEMVMFPARIGQRVQASVLSTRLQKRGQTLPAGHAHHSQPSIQLNGVVVSAPAGDAQRNARSTSNRAGLLGNTPTK